MINLFNPRKPLPAPASVFARAIWALSLAVSSLTAQAQLNPARVVVEPPAVAARFPDPDVRYTSPGLQAGRTDFPSHAEVEAFLHRLAGGSAGVSRGLPGDAVSSIVMPVLRVETLGRSQEGRSIPMAVLAPGGRVNPALPTVLVLAQQHGNEPASGEAALALVATLLDPGESRALFNRVNVLVVPRANPDGAERFARTTASGVDVNRDHLLLRTPEARAIAQATARYRPQVVLDLHEFTVAGRWVEKFGAMQKYDALLQVATVGNMHLGITTLAQADFEAPTHQALAAQGLSSFAYHTTSPDAKDRVVAMGGVQPDTGRNTAGLRPAVSLLLEVRGVGLGRAHLLRRVHTQVVAALTVLEAAASQGPKLLAAVRQAEADTAALACRGELVITAQHSAARQPMVFVDAVTGADKTIEVAWRAAAPLDVQRTRPRPCGYLIAGHQHEALERLKLLGATLQPVALASRWNIERYAIAADEGGQRQDARGSIDDGGDANIRLLRVATQSSTAVVPPGSVYVGLDQPLGALIAAALEPDSQSSWAANRLLAVENDGLLRVMARPDGRWLVRR